MKSIPVSGIFIKRSDPNIRGGRATLSNIYNMTHE